MRAKINIFLEKYIIPFENDNKYLCLHAAKVVQRCAKNWLLENGKVLNGQDLKKARTIYTSFDGIGIAEANV